MSAANGTVAVAVLALMVTMLGVIVRATARWSAMEQRLVELVRENDRFHAAIVDQMKYDRDATDRRLRFLEERQMRAGGVT